jgi:PPP family 3-phenylpropionic acid transporter
LDVPGWNNADRRGYSMKTARIAGDRVSTPLLNCVALYAVLYGAFGAASPFLPALVEERGIAPELIGVLFGAGTAVRLISAPIAARIADRTHALRLTIAVHALATAAAVLGYLLTNSFWPILAISLFHAFALAPLTNLTDALTLVASRQPRPLGFEYGWVRGSGSAAFILVSIGAGWAIGIHGLTIVVWLQALLMLAVPFAVMRVPEIPESSERFTLTQEGILALIYLPAFRRIVLVAALVLGSHALHDTFSVIRWKAAGISPQMISVLWSVAVAAEVFVFLVAGPWLLQRLTPATAIALAAVTAAARWLIAAWSNDLAVLSLIQPLHGITFALLHLACMRLLAQTIPNELAATAQALYGTVGIGAVTAVLTMLSGLLYARLGSGAFLIMSLLSLAALPVAARLKTGAPDAGY